MFLSSRQQDRQTLCQPDSQSISQLISEGLGVARGPWKFMRVSRKRGLNKRRRREGKTREGRVLTPTDFDI